VSSLDEMTKEELLDYARARGISPANAAMSKQEIRDSIDAANGDGDPHGPPEVGGTVTTTMTKDYIGRLLNNPTPGTSQATDYMARSVVAGNKDYMGRSLG